MKKTLLATCALSLLLSTSCAETPDSVKSNTHSLNTDTEASYVSPEQIYNGVDSAYETDYTKFKLPEKDCVNTEIPDGIYNLELSYANSDMDYDVMTSAVEKLNVALSMSIDGTVSVSDGFATLENGGEKIKIEQYSRPYCCWQASETGINTANDNVSSTQLIYLNRTSKSSESGVDEGLKKAADSAKSMADNIGEILGDELDNTVTDGYIYSGENGSDVGYEIEIGKSYKGVDIQNVISRYADDSAYADGKSLMSIAMQTYVDFDSSMNPEYYVGCNAFKIAKAEPIEKVISFKGACDILEEQLADNVSLEFDDVKLMYEPLGTLADSGESTVAENIVCTPKWYFIIDDNQSDGLHAIDYVTVNCVTGEICVIVP